MNERNGIKIIVIELKRCFFIRCASGFLMIDTNMPNTYDRFLSKLKRIGIDLNDIKYLLLTHHHDDHVGFASHILRDTNARLIVHECALPFLHKGQAQNPFIKKGMVRGRFLNPWTRYTMAFLSMFVQREWSYLPVEVSDRDFIIKGDNPSLLQQIGIKGVILYTPGHTSDSISVVLSDGTAFVGDTAMNFMRFFGTHYRPIYAEDYNEVFESWRKLIDNGAKVIYSNHGAPFSVEKLKSYIDSKKLLKKKLL
jgi:glyoxylase-like metal-dependent hydrolase (beta-lactamase superfamily II)